MAQDKYTAVWVSHTSISDFLKCPRSYYLRNVYRDKNTGRKIKYITPSMALGQVVHDVVESLSVLPVDSRFVEPLTDKFETAWKKVEGKKGGFTNSDTEFEYKTRGREMLKRIMQNPGPLKNLAVKIKMDLPHYWLSEEDNIILCGKLDWLEYLPETDSVHIIDFKTSKTDESDGSLQLPIYYLLAIHCQTRPVVKVSYWYIERNEELTERPLPDVTVEEPKILKIAKEIKVARQLDRFKCPSGTGCYACSPMEAILQGNAEYVGVDEYNSDVYILNDASDTDKPESEIL